MTYDHMAGAVVITATEFKAKCLELLDRVHSGDLKRIHITKRGREVAVVESAAASIEGRSFIGWQADPACSLDGLDIDGPIYDPARDGACAPLKGLR